MPKVDQNLSAWRDCRCLELAAQGRTHQQIADALNLERSSVTKRLGRLGRAAAARRDDLRNVLLITQTQQLEYVISEALAGWRKSKEPLRRVSSQEYVGTKEARQAVEEGDEATPRVSHLTTSVVERAGSVMYLETAMSAMDRLRKLYGMDAPIKVAQTDPEGNNPYAGLPDRELKRRIMELMASEFGEMVPHELLAELEGALGGPPLLTDTQLEDLRPPRPDKTDPEA